MTENVRGIQTYYLYQSQNGERFHVEPECASDVTRQTDPLELYGGNVDLSGLNMQQVKNIEPQEGDLCANCLTGELRKRIEEYIQE